MLISGIQQCTLLDFPGNVACIVFTPGCNFRCGYCHNPEFVLPEKIKLLSKNYIPEDAFFTFLQRYAQGKGDVSGVPLLDGVVITGGEPTLMPDLLPFMKKIKSFGLKVKLDTNGNRPEVIRKAIDQGLADYLAMDVKTSIAKYRHLVGPLVNPKKVAESVALLKRGDVPYEFRSTLIKEVHTWPIIDAMTELMIGAKRLFLQSFRPSVTLNPMFERFHPFSDEQMENIAEVFRKKIDKVSVRL